jgi:hypothetical protein
MPEMQQRESILGGGGTSPPLLLIVPVFFACGFTKHRIVQWDIEELLRKTLLVILIPNSMLL